jgi:TolB-like protein/DNA-binding winged helix-turn-helix (wHTH) protein/Tfp pilus assembly protein PilF
MVDSAASSVEVRAIETPAPNARVFRFGTFEVSADSGELHRAGARVRIQPQPFAVLLMLLERSGEVVTREELRKGLWPDATHGDFDQGLNIAVKKLRETLRDSAEAPRFIETLPRRGYRFLAPVTDISPNGSVGTPVTEVPRRSHIIRWLVVVLVLILMAAGVIYRMTSRSTAQQSLRTLAVLPFENLSGDPQQEFFVAGITDEIITDVANISKLNVISRTSIARFKGNQKPLKQVAAELGADYIVEGTVKRDGTRVRVTVRFIDAQHDRLVWAEHYDRDLNEVLGMQTEIAYTIARQVDTQLQIKAGPAKSIRPDAYEAYLRGRSAWNQRNEAGLLESIAQYHKAIQIDPSFANAYAGLADSYATLGYLSYLAPQASFPLARVAAEKALQIDSLDAEAHASLGYVQFYYDWNWNGAEREFRRAIELSPNYATGHHWYSVYLTAMGRFAEARVEIEQARRLDPLSLAIQTDIGFEAFYSSDYERAERQLKSVLDMDPNFAVARLWLGRTYQATGRFEEALVEYQAAESELKKWPVASAALGNAYGKAGYRAKAEEITRELEELSKERYVTAYGMAIVAAGLDNRDRAITFLDQGFREKTHWLVWLRLDQRWYNVRDDERFRQMVHRMNFPSSS